MQLQNAVDSAQEISEVGCCSVSNAVDSALFTEFSSSLGERSSSPSMVRLASDCRVKPQLAESGSV